MLKQRKNNQLTGVPLKMTSDEGMKSPQSRNSDNFLNFLTEKKFNVSGMNNSDKGKILDKALDLHLECNFEGSNLVIKGYQDNLEEFKTFYNNFQKEKNKGSDLSVLKEIPIKSKLQRQGSLIEKKALELGFICEVRSDKIVVLGSEKDIEEKFETLKGYIDEKDEEKKESKEKKELPVIEEEKEDGKSDKYVRKEYTLTQKLKERKSKIEEEGKKLELFYEFYGDKLYVLGYEKIQAAFSDALKKIEEGSTPIKTPSKEDNSKIISKEWELSSIEKKKLDEIKKKAEDEGLIAFDDGEKLYVSGSETKMKEISSLLGEKEEKEEEKTNEIKEHLTKTKIDLSTLNADSGAFEQKEISISTFHRSKKEELETRAKSLDLITDFGYDVVLVTGLASNIGKFILALYEVEAEAKRALYPKYWDFHETRPFSKIPLAADSTEYKKIADLLHNTMDRPLRIKSIERIQNKYLMEHYINNIQKKMESRPGEDINRLLLFHGTRNADPELICKSFDTGFDLQYAAHGSYGKGLYFALNASYSCNGYQHQTQQGTCQVIVADVFLGKHANRTEQGGLKAQSGYDSVFSGSFYIIYNNFHSYPLYLIEYHDDQLRGRGGGGGLFGGGGGLFGGGGGLFGGGFAAGTGLGRVGALGGLGIGGGTGYDDDDDEEDEDYDGEEEDY